MTCSNNGRITWTYSQGVILGGLAELSIADHNATLAESASHHPMTRLADDHGILHDPCEPKCGEDGAQFKGIFVRNLLLFTNTHPRASYSTFIKANADTLWKCAEGPNYQLGERWSGPFQSGNAASQTSALDALSAAATVRTTPKLNRSAGGQLQSPGKE